MAPRIPGSLILTLGLLAVGFAGGAASLTIQRFQNKASTAAAAHELTGGDAERGKTVFSRHACGSCHAIRAVDQADGQVGPSLDGVATRRILAGELANEPTQLVAFVQHPQALRPGSGMPEMGLSEAEARDVAAYLYTLR
jgi:cytochrome c